MYYSVLVSLLSVLKRQEFQDGSVSLKLFLFYVVFGLFWVVLFIVHFLASVVLQELLLVGSFG